MKVKEKKAKKVILTVIIIFALAALFVAAAYLTVYLLGFRIIRYNAPEGTTTFVGKIGKDGLPSSGTVYYASGERAEIDIANGRIAYSDGSVYVGETKELLPHGKGKLELKNESYEGDFYEGEMTGYGTYKYSESIGDRYEGYMKNGKRDGKGKYTWGDGSVYEGEFKNDMKNGEGTYKWADGSSYTGSYYNDVKDGEGTFVFANGDKYEGHFSGDVREGKGKYTWASGEYYIGDFKNNMMDGYGTYFWVSGRTYDGAFKENKIVWQIN